jgi:hypothetical protein
MESWPKTAAQCRGVRPVPSAALTSLPSKEHCIIAINTRWDQVERKGTKFVDVDRQVTEDGEVEWHRQKESNEKLSKGALTMMVATAMLFSAAHICKAAIYDPNREMSHEFTRSDILFMSECANVLLIPVRPSASVALMQARSCDYDETEPENVDQLEGDEIDREKGYQNYMSSSIGVVGSCPMERQLSLNVRHIQISTLSQKRVLRKQRREHLHSALLTYGLDQALEQFVVIVVCTPMRCCHSLGIHGIDVTRL